MQQHEQIITAKLVTELEDKIVFLERELAEAARDEIMLRDIIVGLNKKIQAYEQEQKITKPAPYKY
tara:strand:+ start:731 stop:928 length:198 start_codon:yes stop_codon:yes gene_type:complete